MERETLRAGIDYEAFPSLSHNGMAEQSFLVRDAQKRMDNAASGALWVSFVQLWRLPPRFAEVYSEADFVEG